MGASCATLDRTPVYPLSISSIWLVDVTKITDMLHVLLNVGLHGMFFMQMVVGVGCGISRFSSRNVGSLALDQRHYLDRWCCST